MFNSNKKERNLLLSILINLSITIAEIIGGILSNSLALISDAIHNLNDTLSIFFSYIALKISQKPYNKKWTFGYKRVEIITAFLNTIILIVIVFFISYSAFKRLFDKQEIHSELMLSIAILGLLGNLFSVVLLHKDSRDNLNIRSAYLHLLGDTISSVAVVVGAIFITLFRISLIDVLITFFISIIILKEAYKILKQTVLILMQTVPADIDIEEVKRTLESLENIKNVHHIHIWNLNDIETHFECHIELEKDYCISTTNELTQKISKILLNNFGIKHVTLQYEYSSNCDIKNVYNACDTNCR